MKSLLVGVYCAIVSVVLAQQSNSSSVRLRLYDGTDAVYLQANLTEAEEIIFKSSKFDKTLKTVFVIHGFTHSADSESVVLVARAFLSRGGLNVIGVDWRDLAYFISKPDDAPMKLPYYPQAAANTKIVGEGIAALINKLSSEGLLSIDSVILVGHSLGAQVCGSIGRNLISKASFIIGMDTSLPLFQWFSVHKSLSKDDAAIVHLIHTDGGVLGTSSTEGTASFKINGGQRVQPGCADFLGLEALNISCSHERSYKYLAEAIEFPTAFPAVKCKSLYQFVIRQCDPKLIYMGYPPDQRASGVYYLETNDKPKYGKGAAGTVSVYRYSSINLNIL